MSDDRRCETNADGHTLGHPSATEGLAQLGERSVGDRARGGEVILARLHSQEAQEIKVVEKMAVRAGICCSTDSFGEAIRARLSSNRSLSSLLARVGVSFSQNHSGTTRRLLAAGSLDLRPCWCTDCLIVKGMIPRTRRKYGSSFWAVGVPDRFPEQKNAITKRWLGPTAYRTEPLLRRRHEGECRAR